MRSRWPVEVMIQTGNCAASLSWLCARRSGSKRASTANPSPPNPLSWEVEDWQIVFCVSLQKHVQIGDTINSRHRGLQNCIGRVFFGDTINPRRVRATAQNEHVPVARVFDADGLEGIGPEGFYRRP